MKRLFTLLILGGTLAGCEATPVLDPANYYAGARYYDGAILTDDGYWKRSKAEATN